MSALLYYQISSYLTKYERTRILSERTQQIVDGSTPLIPNVERFTSAYEIAVEELPHEIIEEEPPFFLKGWVLGILAILGLGAVGVFLFLRMSDDGEDDDESEDDDAEEEDFEEDDDEDDLDLEDEEDDIVVEETS